MPNRRHLLRGCAGFLLAQGLSSCQNRDRSLQIHLLQGSIPPRLVKQFQEEFALGKNLVFTPFSALAKAYERLQTKQPPPGDLVTLGDAWLASAVQNRLISPINPQELPNWRNLPPIWQNLARRDAQGFPAEQGQLWGIPYRWGCTLMVYRQDKFSSLSRTPTDWSALWQKELRGRISLPDQPREVIGLTLKHLGYSYNTPRPLEVEQLSRKLDELKPQVKFYSSDYYLEPLLLGDTWLAVGWSGDILRVVANNPQLKVVVPAEGTSLWGDVWVKPQGVNTPSSQPLQQWMNFCLDLPSAHLISRLTYGLSPVVLSQAPQDIPLSVRQDPILSSDRAILDRSEFILPLEGASLAQYQQLWLQLRGSFSRAVPQEDEKLYPD